MKTNLKFVMSIMAVFILALGLNAQEKNEKPQQNYSIEEYSNIPLNPTPAQIDSAYKAEVEKLNKALNSRSVGTGVAYYGNNNSPSWNGTTKRWTNAKFSYSSNDGTLLYTENDLQACIDAMVNNPEHNGGVIYFDSYYVFYSGSTDVKANPKNSTTNINGYGKVILKCRKPTKDWGMLNIGKNNAWRKYEHYQNLPQDTVILNNITIDGGTVWTTESNGNKDEILGRGTKATGVTGNAWPLVWMSNEHGVLIINDGTIIQNLYNYGKETKGGAINHRRGKCYMYGGAIMDCSVNSNSFTGYDGDYSVDNGKIASGAGIYVRASEKITEGGTYYAPSAEFYMYGGSFIGNSSDATYDNYGGAAMYLAGKVRLMGGLIGMEGRGNKANQGGGIVVVQGADVELGGTVKISYNGTPKDKDNASGAGVYVCGTEAKPTVFTMNGGEISHNISYSKGGGLYMKNHSTVNINGSAIINNTVNNKFGSTTSYECGGGIYLENDAVLNLQQNAAVKNNTANYNGGGIYSKISSTVNLYDCTVSDNTCGSDYNGAGIFYAGTDGTASKVNLSGSPKIFNNYAGTGTDNSNNLYMAGSYVNITGDISNSALVNLLNYSTNTPEQDWALPKVVGAGFAHNLTQEEAYRFSYDKEASGVKFNNNGSFNQLILAEPHTISFDMNDGGNAGCQPPSNRSSVEGYTISLPTPDITVYYIDDKKFVFIGWATATDAILGSMTYTIGDSDVTLYAIWANSAEGINVYLYNGKIPDQNKPVGTISNPTNSFSVAKDILVTNLNLLGAGATGRIIIINNPVKIIEDVTFELGDNMSITRYKGDVIGYPAYTGNMFEIGDPITSSPTLTLKNIVIDGSSTGANSVTSYGTIFHLKKGTLNINSGAILQNNYNEYVGSIENSGLGGAIYATTNTTVNLNGGSIQSCRAKSGGAIYANTAEVNIISGTIGGYAGKGNSASDYGSAIAVMATSPVKISGGLISFNYDTSNSLDGTIYLGGNGEATISDGTISNNTSKYGAGISAIGNPNLNITGGTISNNTATTVGGGVYVQSGTTATITGGIISGNNATNGGGVYVCAGAKLKMANNGTKFGQIIQNNAKVAGGGVYVEDATSGTDGIIAVEGSAVILTNKKNNVDNNVYLQDGILISYTNTLHGYVGITTQNIPSAGSNIQIGKNDEAATYTLTDTDAENIYSDNPSYYADLENSSFIYLKAGSVIGNNENVYIDGVNGDDNNNGTTSITAVKTFAKAKDLLKNNGTIYIVNTVTIAQGETWSLKDKGNAKVVRFAGDANLATACADTLISVKENGALSLYNIIIDGGSANATPMIVKYPMISVANGGTVSMFEDCILQNNNNIYDKTIDNSGNGGAIMAAAGGVVNMNNGVLIQNNKAFNGGAVYLSAPTSTISAASLTMNGTAVISNNIADSIGGGVFVGRGNLVMEGGSIVKNTADLGGGVYISATTNIFTEEVTKGTIYISQNPVIAENTNSNIYLANNQIEDVVIIQSRGLTTGSDINVSLEVYPLVNAKKLISKTLDYNTGMIPEEEVKYYHSDQLNYKILLDDGKVYIGTKEYWKNVVTKKPQTGWVNETKSEPVSIGSSNFIFKYNKLCISTPEALAWLISVVNGENGQTANDLRPDTIAGIGSVDTIVFNWIYLENDIDLSEYLWTPIGSKTRVTTIISQDTTINNGDTIINIQTNTTTTTHPFDGFFTGNGHIVSGCCVFEENSDYVGFIGYTGDHFVLSDVGVKDSYMRGRNCVGGLVGYANELAGSPHNYLYGFIFNSYYQGFVGGNDTIGGIVGYNKAKLLNCYAVQEFYAPQATYKGFVAGYNAKANVYNSTTEDSTYYFAYCYGLKDGYLPPVGGGKGTSLARTFNGPNSELISTVPIKYTLSNGSSGDRDVHRLSTALNGYVRMTGAQLKSVEMEHIHKWKRMATDEYPVHAVLYDDYWINNVTSQVEAGIGFQRNDTKKTIHIASAEGFAWLISVVNGYNGQPGDSLTGYYVYLDSDIDMSAHEFTPIGKSENKRFNGVLAGDGKEIHGIYMCNHEYDTLVYTGMIGYLGTKGVVRNAHLAEDCYMVSYSDYVGPVVAYNKKGEVYNTCYHGVVAGFHNVGGLVAYNRGKIHNCMTKMNVTAYPQLGDSNKWVGGLVGYNATNSEIKNSYAVVSVTDIAAEHTGMIAGYNDGTINYVYWQYPLGTTNQVVGTNGTNGTITDGNHRAFSGTNSLESNITVTSSTNILLTALNEYVNEYQTGVYSTWKIKADENEGYPHFNYDAPFVFVIPTDKWSDVVTNKYVTDSTLTFSGSGTKKSPYLIDAADKIAMLAGIINGNVTVNGAGTTISASDYDSKVYKITTDLNVSAHEWVTAGNDSKPFKGVIDGGNHIVEGVYVGAEEYNYQGLFGYFNGATAKHLGVSSSFIKAIDGKQYVGGITGYNFNGKIYDCYNLGYIHGNDYVGGIAGMNSNGGKIYNCYNLGTINGDSYVGGILGYNDANIANDSTVLANSFNRGAVNSVTNYGGGVLGYNAGVLKNVYSSGMITGNGAGGVLGTNVANAKAEEYYWDSDKTSIGISSPSGNASTNALSFSGDYTAWIFDNSRTASFGTSPNITTTPDLVKALNEKVKLSNESQKTNYKMWRVDEAINDGYPTFSDIYNHSSNILWYVNGTDPYTVSTPADLAGLADLTNYYKADLNNNYLYYDEDGIVRGHGPIPSDDFDEVPCFDFTGDTITLGNNVTYNDGTFAYDGTFTSGSTEVLSAAVWNAIGTEKAPFKGTFDGNERTISGIYINNTAADTIGMFGCISNSNVKNVAVVDCFIGASGSGSIIGGIVGKMTGGSEIIDSYCTGIINNKATSGNCYAGGLVGYLETTNDSIRNCYSWATTYANASNATSYAGGIAGYNTGSIENVYNAGNITGKAGNVGSLIGINVAGGKISKSYYLYNTAAGSIGTNTGDESYCFSFTGTGNSCTLSGNGFYGYDLLGLSLNSWRLAQKYSYNSWFPTETYYIFGNATIYWPDVVTKQPDGFKISGMNITIDSEEGLAWLISVVNGYNDQPGLSLDNTTVTVANDLYMEDYQWVPIGTESKPFKGNFVSTHYRISNLYCLSPKYIEDKNVGIFGCIEDAEIKGILAFECQFSSDLTNADIGAGNYLYLGAIAAHAKGNSLIDECRSKSSIYGRASQMRVAGIVGKLEGTSKVYCSSTSSLSSGYTQGGIAAIAEADTEIKNCHARCQPFDLNPTAGDFYAGGIVGINKGTVENCYYMQTQSSDFLSSVAGKTYYGFICGYNAGKVNYCYANRKFFGNTTGLQNLPYIHTTVTGGTSTGCGYFYGVNDMNVPDDVNIAERQIVHIEEEVFPPVGGYTPAPSSTYATSGVTTLKTALNNYVTASANIANDFSTWVNASRYINNDYPVFRYKNYNAVTSVDEGLTLFYYPKFYEALQKYNSFAEGGHITLINNSDISAYQISNDDNVHVYILEDVSLLHNSAITATVDVRLDNTKQATGEYGDWHLVSSSFVNAPIGIINQETVTGFGIEPSPRPTISTKSIIPYTEAADFDKWDFYSYYEPEFHWINFKRGSNNHWHYDGYHYQIFYDNEPAMIPGKGYMMALQDEFVLNGDGLLQNGDVSIPVTRQNTYCPGYNLLGNPYQSYLDFDVFVKSNTGLWNNISDGTYPSYYIYDNDVNGFLPYAYKQTPSSLTASQYIHMHNGFFIVVDNPGKALFTNDMRTNTTDEQSQFRGNGENEEDKIKYPLINVRLYDSDGKTETVVAELNRPDDGGALRLSKVKEANGSIYLKKNEKDYWILFHNEVDNIPLYFEANEDDTFTLEVSCENSTFGYLHLIDNITGENVDLLLNNKYTFTGSTSDYSARFKLVFNYIGIEEQDTPTENEHFAYFNNSELIIDGEGTLQIIDIQGRVLYQTFVSGEDGRVSIPSLPASVYILRLIGEDVKTQKIIIH